jgi:ATP-dependent RNA/DNA helicase IGHMBP2
LGEKIYLWQKNTTNKIKQMSSQQELQELTRLLRIEREEEIRQYEQLIKETTVQERVKNGSCWFPVQVENSGWSLGEHPFILVERHKGRDAQHKIRAGSVVSIFGEVFLANSNEMEEKGVVHFVDKNRMKIIFYGNELPSWVLHNRIGIQLAFDERSYVEMERAIKTVQTAKGNRLAELREILLGYEPARFRRLDYSYEIPQLNHSQNLAVEQVITAEDVAILHGPPGTGKTTTLVQAIRQLSKTEGTILVCAPSNPATDLLTERIAAEGLRVVRVGNLSRIDESLLIHTIEGILDSMPEMNDVKKMRVEANKFFKKADKFHRSFGPKERAERDAARSEAKQILYQARMLEEYLTEKVFNEADVITCTLVSSMNSHLEKRIFHTVVIDEAAQALEAATWIPIIKAERVVLAGDPFQLPPTVKSMEAAKLGLSVTLLEKCVKRLDRIQLLDTQYRMNEIIMGFSNKLFYHNQLKAHESVAHWLINLQGQDDTRPLEFIDTAGCSFDEHTNDETLSHYNPEEYFILRQHLDNLLTLAGEEHKNLSIGIVSPYREQVVMMQDKMRTDFDHFPEADIDIDTIDSFQGQERDIIYITMVRSNPQGEIGFLKDTRRMNVAMTRARKKLIIIGDSATLAHFSFYSQLLDYAEKHDGYATAWEWL